MKLLSLVFLFCSISFSALAQDSSKISTPDPKKKIQIVEASCGECKFGMDSKGCELAVRIDGKTYLVEGTSIHDHGDAHADDGFCNAVRKAEVQGKVVGKKYKATYFKLVDSEAKQ